MIPGVLAYGLTFFCVKFCIYSFLLWLPKFLNEVYSFEKAEIANIQTVFEVGTLLGGFTLGYASDKLQGRRSPVAAASILISLFLSIYLTINYHSMTATSLSTLFFFMGLLMGGVMHLIVITCSADIGHH